MLFLFFLSFFKTALHIIICPIYFFTVDVMPHHLFRGVCVEGGWVGCLGWMDDLRFYVLFNNISVILGRCSDDNERLCAK